MGWGRCESEESFHNESCDDTFNFTDSASCCIRGKSTNQKCRSKRENHLHQYPWTKKQENKKTRDTHKEIGLKERLGETIRERGIGGWESTANKI